MATVSLKNVKKIYDNKVTAVHDFNLEIADKEFIVLVGPSGCGMKREYDYVLLDFRPSLGMLVINALSASDYVLVPVQADYLAAEGMTELVGTVRSVQRQINPRLKIGGVFLTMANETAFRRDIVNSVKENFGRRLPVLDTVIPSTVRLAEVSTADKSIFQHEPRGRAADAYRRLTKEVLEIGQKERSRASDLGR